MQEQDRLEMSEGSFCKKERARTVRINELSDLLWLSEHEQGVRFLAGELRRLGMGSVLFANEGAVEKYNAACGLVSRLAKINPQGCLCVLAACWDIPGHEQLFTAIAIDGQEKNV